MEFTGAQGRSRDVKVVSGVQGRSGETRRGQGWSMESRADMELVKKFTQARFLKTKFYPKVRKSQ